MAGIEPGNQRRRAGQARHRPHESEVADRSKITKALVGEHQRHPIEHERFDDA